MCKSAKYTKVSASVFAIEDEPLCTLTCGAASESLKTSLTSGKDCSKNTQILLESGATECFINKNFLREVGLIPNSNKSLTTMDSTQLKAEVLGMVSAKIENFEQDYNRFQLGEVKNL